MAVSDEEILDRYGVSKVALAEVLGVTRQSVARGLDKGRGFITPKKAANIFAYLQTQIPEISAHEFREACIKELGLSPDAFQVVPTSADIDQMYYESSINETQITFNVEEIWVCTPRPRELFHRGYLSSIAKKVYKTNDKSNIKRMLFFVPAEYAEALSLAISAELKDVDASDQIWLQILSCQAAALSPHYLLLNPRTDAAIGKVAAETEDRFLTVPRSITDALIDNFVSAGINLFNEGPTYPFENTHFKLIFDSKSEGK